MDQMKELLKQIQELAGVGIDAIDQADQGGGEGGAPAEGAPPEGAPPGAGGPPPAA